ncbi:T6SS effector BTH_I2691 family protein [Paraburkholderia phymatum]|uniref:Toxin VasX N-terminal region domain-containing protein n=1 Tax=Paraburkholderia phymatum (strain DSM 17167 / CIP 108236 / LMG 21445 / STM815) TaxID=391038 RepID=B2JTX3_PARP8|nr:T6SS effector BTH_I2691 family protein [Paraburkholderia phymatum]ACC76026.1 hypothetical protein Bphy_7020 [Paraburkholderia phymatum STM815]
MSASTPAFNPLAQSMATAQKCDFCEKSGLAILPVRPAVMHPNSGAPQLPAALQPVDGEGGKALTVPGQTAQYTGRVLRSGYLYLYDERGFWEKYWITDYGYFMKVPVGVPLNPAFTVGREPCDKTGHKEIAACITVKDPAHAKRIWVAFSDVEWTPRVLKLHQDESYRKRHMRGFDVNAWMGSHHAPHAQTLDSVSSVVAEYAPKSKVETFAFSPYMFRSRASTLDALLGAAKTLGPGPGALLVLNDPVAAATEIAARLSELPHKFMSKDDRVRKLNASTAILGMQQVLSEKAEETTVSASDQLDMDNEWMDDGTGGVMRNPWPQKLPELTNRDLTTASSDSWKKYLKDYDEKSRDGWQRQFQTDFDTYTKQTLIPLAEAHVAWMKSGQLANHLDCAYDDASVEVGLVYVRILTMCMQGSQQYKPCADLYYKWISGSYSEEENLLLRAIVLNQKKLRDQIKEDIKPAITWTTIGWDNLCAGFVGLADTALEKSADVLTDFLVAAGGSITKLLQEAVEGPVRHGLVAVGMASQRPVVPVELTGAYRTFRGSLIRQLIKASGIKGLGENAMQREVAQALRRLGIHGEPMSSVVPVRLMVMIDGETLKGMPKGLSKAEQAKWVASSLRTAEDIEALNLSAWRERINVDIPTSAGNAAAKAAKAFPVIGNLIAGYVQVATARSIFQSAKTTTGLAGVENWSRLLGSASLISSTAADSVKRMMEALAHSKLVAGRAAYLEEFAARLAPWAKGFGIAGALIGAVWDGIEAYQAFEKGDENLFRAYFFSALAGVGIAAAIYFGSILLAIAAAVLYLFAQYRIAALGDDKLDTWLQRCIWGTDTANRYSSSGIEMTEFGSAAGF